MALFLALAIALAQSGQNPLAGTWNADFSRSTQHPDAALERVTIQVAVAGNAVTITDKHVFANGKETTGVHTFEADGKERSFEAPAAGPGLTVTAKWTAPRVLDTVVRREGKELTRVVYEVTPDGSTLTATRTGMLAQVIVFVRE